MIRRVAIIGAGCSGLTAIKACLEENLQPICFERENDIGGLWNYSDEAKIGKGSVYKTTVINVSKELMAFSDFPPSSDFPTFAPHEYVLQYFKSYADNFDLLQYIRFRTSVEKVKQADDYEQTGRWVVTFREDSTNQIKEEIFDAVMVCIGHHTFPYIPLYPGKRLFRGRILHSHSYRLSSDFSDKRVLVVGIGNSAVDLAVDLCKHAKQVYLSTRRGAWVISRKGLFGIPLDAIANTRILFCLPKSILKWAVELAANLHCNHSLFGLKPKHKGLETHPTINDDLPVRMLSSQVVLKPNIKQFYEHGVVFENDEALEVDDVIFATGYDYKLPFLDDDIIKIRNNDVRLYKYMFPPNLQHPTLAVIGLVQIIGAVIPVSEIQCRWFTRVLKGKCELPSREVMEKDIQEKRNRNSDYVQTQRHTIQSFYIELMDEIASEIGAKPNLLKLMFTDSVLAFHCMFSPCIPAQFRLVGPGKWDGARECIINAWKRNLSSMKSSYLHCNRSEKKRETAGYKIKTILKALCFIMIAMYLYVTWFSV